MAMIKLRNPRDVKAGLQRLCAFYDRKIILTDSHEHHLAVLGLLWNSDVLVRRWTYKALALLGLPGDLPALISRVSTEEDIENQTWAIAAVIKLGRNLSTSQAIHQAGITDSLPLLLAARLFASAQWLRDEPKPPTISINQADSMTLKWAALLSGYDRAPPNLFDPNYDNKILLGELNGHSNPEVAEYSVWALVQNDAYSISNLTLSPDQAALKPPNVRRWVNRLTAKAPETLISDPEFFENLTFDDEFAAREGLALGIRSPDFAPLSPVISNWYSRESDFTIRTVLLEHMAASATAEPSYRDFVIDAFKAAQRDSSLRMRLISSSEGSSLHHDLKRIELREVAKDENLELFSEEQDRRAPMTVWNVQNMTAGTVVGGDMYGNVLQAVNQMPATSPEREVLEKLLAVLPKAPELAEGIRSNLLTASSAVASNPTPENKSALAGAAKAVFTALEKGTALAAHVGEIIEFISDWF